MTVNPGFAGQKLTAGAIRKIGDCRRFLGDHGLSVPIMVDGNVSFEHIPKMVAAGADILIAGSSSWFNRRASLRENVRKTEEAIAAGLQIRNA
jgi:ribulose-phosphate 3-epimerase